MRAWCTQCDLVKTKDVELVGRELELAVREFGREVRAKHPLKVHKGHVIRVQYTT